MTHQHLNASSGASADMLPRELDNRTSDGIHVRLLWHPHDNHVSVTVNDTKTGESFELEVEGGQRPLDVFDHPYAYAAHTVPMAEESDNPAARCRP